MKGENVPINNNFFSESALLFGEIRTRAPVRQGKMYTLPCTGMNSKGLCATLG